MCTLMACVCNEVLWREFLCPKLTHIFLINYAIEMLWNNIVSFVFHVFIKLLCVAIGKFGEHLTEELQLLSAVLWEMLLHLLLPSNFSWASNLSQKFLCLKKIIIVDIVGGTGSEHQGWINYVFKILVCEVWNTLTLKKIFWVSGKWMFFYLRLNICWVRTVTSIKWNSYILWKFTKIAIGCWLKIQVVCQSKFSICRNSHIIVWLFMIVNSSQLKA